METKDEYLIVRYFKRSEMECFNHETLYCAVLYCQRDDLASTELALRNKPFGVLCYGTCRSCAMLVNVDRVNLLITTALFSETSKTKKTRVVTLPYGPISYRWSYFAGCYCSVTEH